MKDKDRAKKIVRFVCGLLVSFALIAWMVMVTLEEGGGLKGSRPEAGGAAAFLSLTPFMLFGGLYGYFISFIIFLALFITRMALNMEDAYMMAVYLAGMYLYSMMGQYRWFRMRSKALAGCLATAALTAVLRFICANAFAEYRLIGFSADIIIKELINASANAALSGLVLYLFFNHATDGMKECFPIGVGYTGAYIKDLLLQNSLRKTRLSRKITFIIIGLIVILGIFGSIFSKILLSDMTAMRGPAPGDIPDPSQMQDFMRSSYGNVFVIKILLLNLCVGLPLAGIVNFYMKMQIGAPIGRLSSFMLNFMDTKDEERAAYAGSIKEIRTRTHDEITELYHATEIMAMEVTGYIETVREEQRLEEDLRVAKAASEAKSAFLSNMSHEIRTPINAVLGMDEMILREAEDKEIRRYAADIKNAGHTLLSLVNDILDFSKIEAGKMDILPVQYQTGSMINDLVNMLSQKAEEKGLELILDIDETLPSLLYGDEVRIKQCITNILTNAVKYTEKGSVTLKLCYEKRGEDEILLKVSVKDTGIGIKEEDLAKLYSPFERIEEIRNRTIEGTGLGMSIVKKLLAMMDSKMEVKSVYGEGSEFSFELLQKVCDSSPIGDFVQAYRDAVDSMERYSESFHAPEARVLIVDDTRMNLNVICALLKSTQLQIDTAESGKETLKKVCEKHYDCIFLDHRMPEMDGIETFEAMKTIEGNMNRETPCIALTANAVAGARDMYLAAGFRDYLSKPVESSRLEKLLRKYLPADKLILAEDEGFVSGSGGSGEAEDEGLSALKAVSGIDLKAGLKNCGSPEVLLGAIKDFYTVIDEKADKTEGFAAAGDYRNYTVLVHALKSSARLIGAASLSEKAAYLEQCGNDGNAAEIEKKTPELLSEYRSYKEKLAVVAAGKEDTELPEIAAGELAGAYRDIREVVEAYDFDSADSMLEMLKEYRIPKEEKERFGKLVLLMSSVDREGILGLLSDI